MNTTTMAKFCTQCGAKLDDDDLFCGVCGVSLVKQDTDDHSAEKSEPSAETPEYEPVSDQTTTVSQNNKKKPPVIALIAVVVVVVALIICIMPKGSKNAVDYFDPSAHQSEGPASNKKGLSDTEVQAIAKKLNEEINFFGDTSDAYNLSYSDFKIESDNYNRVIHNIGSNWMDLLTSCLL
ncbi:MAG: zinc ribbon domain-containing protein [Eubacteriales bacterium]|nr:zinc ribbon domain-containing protein [Eubacteriales bacterium]